MNAVAAGVIMTADEPVEALSALLKAIPRHDELSAEDLYGADMKVAAIYQEVLQILAGVYGLPEGEARAILALDGVAYTRRLHEIALGMDFSGMPLGGE